MHPELEVFRLQKQPLWTAVASVLQGHGLAVSAILTVLPLKAPEAPQTHLPSFCLCHPPSCRDSSTHKQK